ncbi:hypothetical protein E8E12_004893 [Didymella heteroderae]|uniref:Uncharacterized protein n=1 Tax=Didymella heteroderae TaxID=1769908 RepID=A0A9P4WK85_9PLEO|nr:hypothetical protein E8E12_004893 [Didymella heteroderae]
MTPQPVTPRSKATSMTTSLASEPGRYRILRGELSDIREEMWTVKASAKKLKIKYGKLRKEKAHSIDVNIRERHKLERKKAMAELEKKHLAEKDAEKAEYKALVTEFEIREKILSKQLDSIVQRELTVEQEMKRRRQSLSLEELLAYVDKRADEEHMRKRSKTEGGNADDEKA